MTLSVSLAESELTVDPGRLVRTEVTVRNDSLRPERVRLQVVGPAARWSWVVPPELEVAAGAEVVVSVGFRTQRTPEPAAGTLAFDVVTIPAVGHESESGARVLAANSAPEARASGVLTVTPFQDLAVELDPPDARPTIPTEHNLVVQNRGNVSASTTLRASGDAGMEVVIGSRVVYTPPGERIRVPVSLRPGTRPLFQGRTLPFTVSAATDGGEPITLPGGMEQEARFTGRIVGIAAAVAVLLLAFGLRLTVLAPGESSLAAGDTADGSSAPAGRTLTTLARSEEGVRCAAEGHRDTRATGLTPDRIPTLPPDFAFFQVASDNCSPVRWNPCEPVHFVINPANAPPTGIADTKEAFTRLAKATGMTYIYDGLTDEATTSTNRAFQPDRYPRRWAPILVHWVVSSRDEDVQVAGGGFPTQVGDVYVTGNLFLNPNLITNKETRTTVAGGFGSGVSIGAIGAEGVTWGRLILHELAHITGLGHTSEPSNLMYPETSDQTGATAFSEDDLAGLKLLGKDAGCLDAPTPIPQAIAQRGGGRSGPAATTPGTSATTVAPRQP